MEEQDLSEVQPVVPALMVPGAGALRATDREAEAAHPDSDGLIRAQLVQGF